MFVDGEGARPEYKSHCPRQQCLRSEQQIVSQQRYRPVYLPGAEPQCCDLCHSKQQSTIPKDKNRLRWTSKSFFDNETRSLIYPNSSILLLLPFLHG